MNTKLWISVISLALAGAACDGTTSETGRANTQATVNAQPNAATNSTSAGTTPETETGPTDAKTFDEKLGSRVSFHTERAESKDSWIDWNTVARLEMERARIKGVGDHEEQAAAALEKAFALVETPPIEILVTRARLAQTQHRFADARTDLEAALQQENGPVGAYQASKILAGVVAYQAGEFQEALALWNESSRISESASIELLFADLYAHTGQPELAKQHLDKAVELGRKDEDFSAAWILVQRGLYDLDRGRPAEAKVFYEEANERFSGWYLVEEHLAETQALTGELDKAEALYKSVVHRVPDPELMAAYAGVLEEQGKTEQAAEMLEAARVALFKAAEEDPAGTSGHGIDLMVEFDPAKAVELARLDFGARPGPSSAEQLAYTLVVAGEIGEAWTVLEPGLSTPYTSGRYHAVVWKIATERGDTELAAEHEELARAWNPNIIEELFE